MDAPAARQLCQGAARRKLDVVRGQASEQHAAAHSGGGDAEAGVDLLLSMRDWTSISNTAVRAACCEGCNSTAMHDKSRAGCM